MTSKLFGVEGEANSLWSGELAPIEPEERTWSAANVAPVWAAMAVSLPAYLYASCLSALGLSVGGVLVSALAGGLLVSALAVGCGDAGVRYGIPFAVLARMAFGVIGAGMPVAIRLLVGCAWVGIGCWLGAEAVSYAVALMGLPPSMWIAGACFTLMLVTVAVPWRRGWRPFAGVLGGACLLLFLVVSFSIELMARGWRPFAHDPSLPVWPAFPAGHGIVLGATALLGLWLPAALGAADGARRVGSRRAHAWSIAAMPAATVLFSCLVAVTAGMMGGGPNLWNPLLLADGVTRQMSAVACLLALAAAALLSAGALCRWLGGEIAVTVPAGLSTAGARWLAVLAGALTMPWRWVSSPERYIGEWLNGCAGLLAPLAAILLVEYFGLRRRWLNVGDLYQRDGLYEYTRGWNGRAFGAAAAGWLVMVFVAAAPSFAGWRGGAVWIGTGVSAASYWVLRSGPPEAAQIPPAPLLIPLAGFETEGASG